MNKNFTHLHVHSHYSLLDGLAKINGIIKKTKEDGLNAVALTDHGNLYGAIEFYKKAKKEGIKPIMGVEAYYAPNSRKNKGGPGDKTRHHITLLAKNNTGWRNIIKMVTDANLEGFYYKPRIDKELIQKYHEGIICLSGCLSGELSRLIKTKKFDEAEKLAQWYKNIFGDDYYLEIQPHTPDLHQPFIDLSKKLDIPLVATQDTHYLYNEDKDAHEVLLAVQTKNPLDSEDRMSLKEFDIHLKSPEEMAEDFKNIPKALENTQKITEKCNVEIELGKNKIPDFPLPSGYKNEEEYLKKLLKDRLPQRYERVTPEIKKRLERELKIIKKTGFVNYFLIVQDFVNWAKDHGIVVGPGRGSAAGSIVSYILGITNIDPLKYDLLFERFLNPERVQVPDIDVDFTDTRRDEVLAYVRQKYGENKVAQIITFGTMMARAAVRDTGRALGFSYSFCDKIAKLIPWNTPLEKALETVPELKKEYERNEEVQKLIDFSKKLEGTVRHASVHACGVVMSPEPLTNFVPLQKAPQGVDTVITQFEMKSVEDLGLLKMDFLGLRNLTIIENTLNLIEENQGKKIDINNLPLDDKKTFNLLRRADTIGVFQLESSGMRRYLKELKPTGLEDIIVILSLYRPGPMDLIPIYIKRKQGREKVTYLHPKLKPILTQTYGVGIYQEQMMRIARDLAGFSLAEADILRKAMGKKIQTLLDKQKEKLINGMVKNGIDQKTAKKIWELFPPFARYGFNRSHSASYAMISYQTAYLKAHYPVEFMASLLNISANDVERINFFINESNRIGIEVLPPDVNESFENFTITEDKKNIRFGLLAIKNLGQNIAKNIIEERTKGGPYGDLADFLNRVHHRDLNKKSLESLIKCGAFDSLGVDRSQALNSINEILKFNQASKKIKESNQGDLFGAQATTMNLNLQPGNKIEKSKILEWEKELLGLYLTDHPFNEYKEKVKGKVKPLKEVAHYDGGQNGNGWNGNGNGISVNVAGIITNVQSVITKKGDPMIFATIEDDEDNIEILVFSNILSKSREIWTPGKIIIANGKLSFRNNDPKIICNAVKEL